MTLILNHHQSNKMVFMSGSRANDDLSSVIPKKLRFELERARLLSQLEAASDLQLTALIAPSGYGKTTLLAQFARIEGRKTTTTWASWATTSAA